MYSKLINKKIKENYIGYQQITEEIENFYNNVSMEDLWKIKNENKFDVNEREWLQKLDILRETKDISISFIILCKNEERCISRCLDNILIECIDSDEIIVIDTGSVDNTLDIIKKDYKKVKLYEFAWQEDFSEIRNHGISIAQNNWIFFIDSDEIVVKGSILQLRKYLKILEWFEYENILVSPTIVNYNNHIIKSVKRIFRKTDGIKYYGLVHEEPRKIISKLGKDLFNVSFKNVILKHDGYRINIIISKDKVKRNYSLLRKMINREPENPRWKYFLCRDCSQLLEEKEYKEILTEVLERCTNEHIFFRYKIGALTDLIGYYLKKGNLEQFDIYLGQLENEIPESSNVIYFKSIKKYFICKKEMSNLLKQLIEYRKSRTDIEYESLHSGYYHIDHVISQLLFQLGYYSDAFKIMEYLEEKEYAFYRPAFKELHNILDSIYEDK